MPLVSIIIPNYNHARYLRQRIESVLSQTYQNKEIFILDDCSTDASLDVINECTAGKVNLHVNAKNSGSTFKQWNRGFSLAKGKYIWIAESDDFSEPDFLETLVGRMEANPCASLAFSQSMVVDETGQPMFSFQRETDFIDESHWSGDYSASGADERARFLSAANTIPNASAVLTRRTAIDRVGGADTGYRLAGDWLFWMRILEAGDVEFVSRPLNYFRKHKNTVRANMDANAMRVVEYYRIATYIFKTCSLNWRQKLRVKRLMLRSWFGWYCQADAAQRAKYKREIQEAARGFLVFPMLEMKLFGSVKGTRNALFGMR